MTLDGFWNERPMEARSSPPRYMLAFIWGEMGDANVVGYDGIVRFVMASWGDGIGN